MVAPKLVGYWYPPEEARAARDGGKLLSLRVETSLRCNLRCSYCSLSTRMHRPKEISYERICDVISQAHMLGARSVVVIGGGEPTIYPRFADLIGFIHALGMIPVVFTNTTTMTKDLAKFLFDHDCSVIGKLDSLRPQIQDQWAGRKGTFQKIMEGLDVLESAGYCDVSDPCSLRLGVSFVINRVNIGELPDLWRFCRRRRIFPNLEMMIPNQRAERLAGLMPSRDEWRDAKLGLLDIDRREFGFEWVPYTPLLGCGCLQVLYGAYLTVEGLVRPCAEIQIDGASILAHTLADILQLPFFQFVRHVDKNLQGKCRSCLHNDVCIGCRGMAFTVGMLKGMDAASAVSAEDPTCFRPESN